MIFPFNLILYIANGNNDRGGGSMHIKILLIVFATTAGIMLSLPTPSSAIPEEGLVFCFAFNEGQGDNVKIHLPLFQDTPYSLDNRYRFSFACYRVRDDLVSHTLSRVTPTRYKQFSRKHSIT